MFTVTEATLGLYYLFLTLLHLPHSLLWFFLAIYWRNY